MKSYFVIGGILVIAIGLLVYSNLPKKANAALDSFAKCLTDTGAVMYGAEWCPHCQNEKKAFGDSFRLVSYVECPNEPKLCVEKNITGYPTWVLGDGTKLEGEQGLQKLGEATSCEIPHAVQ